MDIGLQGRVALVTGASKGIGRAIAAEMVAEGCVVGMSSRSRERIEEAVSDIGAAGGFVWDSADPDGAAGLVDAVEAALGPVDVLVVNTGGPAARPDALGFSREEWEAAYRALVLGPMALLERALPGMRERRWGRVVNVAGTTVREPQPVLMLSTAHRSSMLGAFKTIARQVAPDGVTLNTLLPGRIATERLFSLLGSEEAARAAAAAEVPAGRLGTVEDLAAAATFLCSDRAGYVTGQVLAVDGGLLRGI